MHTNNRGVEVDQKVCVVVIWLQGHIFTFCLIEIYFKIFAQKYVESGVGVCHVSPCLPPPLSSCNFLFHYSDYLDLPSPVHLDCTVTLGAVVVLIVW
jgi:hypothetical protein